MSSTQKNLSPYLNKYTFIFGCYGLAASIIHNGLMRRPSWSGIHRHFLYSVFGAGVGSFLGVVERERLGRRDFYIDDYVARHPEDFQKPPPKKMSEKFEPHIPCPSSI